MKLQFDAEALSEYQDAAQFAEDHFGSGAKFVLAIAVNFSEPFS